MRCKGLIVKEFIPDVIAPSACATPWTSMAAFVYIITSPTYFWMMTYEIYIRMPVPRMWLKSYLAQHVAEVQNAIHFWLVYKMINPHWVWRQFLIIWASFKLYMGAAILRLWSLWSLHSTIREWSYAEPWYWWPTHSSARLTCGSFLIDTALYLHQLPKNVELYIVLIYYFQLLWSYMTA